MASRQASQTTRSSNSPFAEEEAVGVWLTKVRLVSALFGFSQIDTPIFEETGLYVRGVGEGTDIVDKEMYSFQDKGGSDDEPPGADR
mgnify:CR=1 FL=1